MNAEYCSSLLVQLKDFFKKNAIGAVRSPRGVLFLHNFTAHRALPTQKKTGYIRLLHRPPYSLDLAPFGLPPVSWSEKQKRHFWSGAVIATAET
jgi:hypothetical protein